MQRTFEITRTSRKIVSQFLDSYSLEQLNKIPNGFKNNLIWNIAHIVVTQQLLVYKFSGLPMMVSDELVQKYMKGTKPELDATQADVDEVVTARREDFFDPVEKREGLKIVVVPFAIDPLPARERCQPAIGGDRLLHRRIAAAKPSALPELIADRHEEL